MSDLISYKLCDLYELGSGISTKPEQAGHGYPFCSFSTIFNNPILPDVLPDLMNTSEEERITFSIKEGDVFFTRTSETVDELAMSSVAVKDYQNATFSGFAKRLRPKKSGIVYSKYMAFFFRSAYFRKIVTNKAVMTLRASFNEDIFNDIVIEVPNYEEQVRIGDYFFLIEQKIRNNASICSDLESITKTIYDYWFLQFEFPNEKGKPYMSSGGEMVWNDELKREIPKGWNVQNLINNSLCKPIKNGLKPFKSKCYLPTGNINGENIIDGNYVTPDSKESRANMQPSKYSVWFAKMKNSIKHISIPGNSDWFIDKYILSTGMEGLQCQKDTFAYVHSFINSTFFEKQKDILAHGATQESVNDQDLTNVKFIIPDDDILKRYYTTINPYLELKFNLFRQNQELSSLRDFLLPLLMNGQVTFKEDEE